MSDTDTVIPLFDRPFGPEEIDLLVSIYKELCAELPPHMNTGEMRETIVLRILSAASHGPLERSRLRAQAAILREGPDPWAIRCLPQFKRPKL